MDANPQGNIVTDTILNVEHMSMKFGGLVAI